ncbi:MAG TPA: hypothetical protein PLI45_02965 [Candidatus Woesebacteria bacterium]|nr:hypothetical protein [Candidatus Woesebacteria bacterium]
MASLINNEKYALYYQKIGLLYKRPEVKASIEIILSIFSVIILITAAIRPTLVNVATLQKKIEDQEAVSRKADTKITQLLNAQKQLQTHASNLGLFDEAVPDNFSYTGMSERWEYLARKNNVNIESISLPGYTLYGKGIVKGDWSSRIVKPSANNIIVSTATFSVTGKPLNVVAFLNDVENMDRLAVIDSVSLSKQLGLTKADDLLKASGQITFYFYSTTK